MAAPSYQNLRNWDVDDVSRWLGQIHLSSLIPNFERIGITGLDIPQIDDRYIRERLKVVKPAEVMALKGALSKLVEDSQQPVRKKSAHQRLDQRSGTTHSSDKVLKSPPSMNAPWTMPRNYTVSGGVPLSTGKEKATRAPQLISGGSAQELLDDHVRYSGWIRKQGGGYKNWKRRYLILREGCLYYFANETASHPKGSFVLVGYTASPCTDPKITEKFKWTLKLSPGNSSLRTYYIALGAKKEMECWRQAIEEEIDACTMRRVSSPSPTCTMPSSIASSTVPAPFEPPIANDDDDDDFDDDEEMGNIYDEPENDDDPYSQPDEGERIYDQPEGESDDDDDDDPYSQVRDSVVNLVPGASHTLSSPGGAPHKAGGLGKGPPPTVPVRSLVSLQQMRTHNDEQSTENPYLPIIGSGPATDGGAVSPLERTRSSPPVSQDESLKSARRGSGSLGIQLPEEFDDNFEESHDSEDSYQGDDPDAYYIMFRKPDELMPPSCVYNRLDRADADRLLRAKYRDGTYLIREGTHAGTEKVLSVWHIDRCRHYKLFKDEQNGTYSLTQGQTFKTIPELLQYYALQSHLPKSDFYLGDPYYPDDH